MKAEQLSPPGVRKLTPYQPGKPIGELERELGLTHIVKLASNENPLGPSPKALEALRLGVEDLHLYPDGGGFGLKAALAGKLGVASAQITLGNGSNDVLELAARAFLSVETSAVFSQHAFAVYPIVTQAVGAQTRVALAHDGSRGPRYGHDLEAMAGLVDETTRLRFLNRLWWSWTRRISSMSVSLTTSTRWNGWAIFRISSSPAPFPRRMGWPACGWVMRSPAKK